MENSSPISTLGTAKLSQKKMRLSALGANCWITVLSSMEPDSIELSTKPSATAPHEIAPSELRG